MRQLWFVYYNSERNLVVRMKISKNRHKFWVVNSQSADLVLKTSGARDGMGRDTSATRSK